MHTHAISDNLAFAQPHLNQSRDTAAKHAEIARRYAWHAKQSRPPGQYVSNLRLRELKRIRNDRLNREAPNLGLVQWLLDNPKRLKAATAGRWIKLTAEERGRLKVRTIRAYDVDHEQEALAMRRKRQRAYRERERRKAGAMLRADYEANSAARLRPWEAVGMSRRTWYRKGKPDAAAQHGVGASSDTGHATHILSIQCVDDPVSAVSAPRAPRGTNLRSPRRVTGAARAESGQPMSERGVPACESSRHVVLSPSLCFEMLAFLVLHGVTRGEMGLPRDSGGPDL